MAKTHLGQSGPFVDYPTFLPKTAAVAVPSDRLTATFRVEAQLSPGVWTDLTFDVLTATGIHGSRGTSGSGPLDLVADPGRLEFSLRNDQGNTGHTRGWYSPMHSNVRSGWQEGIPVRVISDFLDQERVMWRGTIVTIDPTPGGIPQSAAVIAQDYIGDLVEANVRSLDPQIDQSEVDLMTAVLAALPTESQPIATNFDPPLDVYPFAFDTTGGGRAAVGLLHDATINALGMLFGAADGTLTYINRHTIVLTTSGLTLDDDVLLVRGPGFSGRSSLVNVYNRIRITIHPKTELAATLFAATQPVAIDGGQTIELWDNYSDPNNRDRLIGGKDFDTPLTPSVDYTANELENGSGADRTSSLQIVITPFLSSAKSVITNTSAETIFVTMRQLTGVGLFDNAPLTFESYSAQSYGDRPLEFDLQLQTDPLVTQDEADYLKSQLSDRTRRGEEFVFDPQRSQALMTGALSLDVGAVVTASESTTGLSNVDFIIRGIAFDIDPGGPSGFNLTMRYAVVPRISTAIFIFDDPVHGLFDSAESVLGYA